MNQCTSQAAIAFINQTHHLINTPLTNSGQTLLMVACSINSINLIRAAIGFKPNLNIKDNIGRTVLHYCAAIGSI
jgi:ankyrin repeat protein